MTDRKPILRLLRKHKPVDDEEKLSLQEIIDFVSEDEKCFESSHLPGHITGAAFVVDPGLKYTLLTLHTEFNKWFQLGGHSDGHHLVPETALREAGEESGLQSLKFHPDVAGVFDVSAHSIPQTTKMPPHKHFDVRFLLVADKSETLHITSESRDLKWVALKDIEKYGPGKGLLRMTKKVLQLREKLMK